jgi:hypothetical protein
MEVKLQAFWTIDMGHLAWFKMYEALCPPPSPVKRRPLTRDTSFSIFLNQTQQLMVSSPAIGMNLRNRLS